MQPLTTTMLVGMAFASGMLVPLIGIHWTEDFSRLEALNAILWGGERDAAVLATASDDIPVEPVSTSSVGDRLGTSAATDLILIGQDDVAPASATTSTTGVSAPPEREFRTGAPLRLTP